MVRSSLRPTSAGTLAFVCALCLLTWPPAASTASAQSEYTVRVALRNQAVIVEPPPPQGATVQLQRDGAPQADGFPTDRSEQRTTFGFILHRIEPGDVLTLAMPDGTSAVEVTVPDMSFTYAADAGRVIGSAPPGATVHIEAEHSGGDGTAVFKGETVAAPDGRIAVPLPAPAAPRHRGTSTLTNTAGHVFTVPFQMPWARVELGSNEVQVGATAGLTGTLRQRNLTGGTSTNPLPQYGRADNPFAPDALQATRVARVTEPIQPGHAITLTVATMPGELPVRQGLDVPDLDVQLDPNADRIVVTGPPQRRATLTITRPDGTTLEARGTIDASGRWAVDRSGLEDLTTGWAATAEVDVGDGWTVARTSRISSIEVTMHRGLIIGVTQPGVQVSMWLLDADGVEVGRWSTQAGDDGRFYLESVRVGAAGGREREVHPVEPGDTVFVDLSGGDPIALQIPELHVRTDTAADLVEGTGPPGARLELTVQDRDEVLVTVDEVSVGPDGRFRIPLDGQHDLEPLDAGRLSLLRADGHRIGVDWVAPETRIDLDGGIANIIGPLHRTFDVAIEDPSGTVRARFQGRSDVGNLWTFSSWEGGIPRDLFGRKVRPEPGDRVVGVFGDDRLDFVIPELQVAIDEDRERIHGTSTAPQKTPLDVQIRAEAGGQRDVDTQLGADGHFDVDLGATEPPWTVHANDSVYVALFPQDARVIRRTAVPGMILDLLAPALSVRVPGNLPSTIEHRRGGTVINNLAVAGHPRGRVDVTLRGDGGLWDLQPGDRLVLIPRGQDGPPPSVLVIPPLSMTYDQVENQIRGCATVPQGATFDVSSLPGGRWTQKLTWDGDGCFSIDLDDHQNPNPIGPPTPLRLSAGDTAIARMTLDNGHAVFLKRKVPRLHLQMGSPTVCIEGDASAEISLSVTQRSDSAQATAEGHIDPWGRGQIGIRTSAGAAVPITDGMIIRGTIGDLAVTASVPRFRAAADWSLRQLTLEGAAGGDVRVSSDARFTDCWGETYTPPREGNTVLHTTTATLDGDGHGTANIGRLFAGTEDIGEGVRATHITEHEHHVSIVRYPLQLHARLGSDRVVARTGQFERVTGELVDDEGGVLATAMGQADVNGDVTLRMSGDDRLLETGRTVRVSAPSDTAAFELPPLDFDWSSAGLDGRTVPHHAVSITLGVSMIGQLGTLRRADDRGRFSLRPSDIPPGEDWSLEHVTDVSAAIDVPPRHRVERHADVMGEPPVPTPGVPPSDRVYLPYAGRSMP